MPPTYDISPPNEGNEPDIARHDEKDLWRCPQLGGPVRFGYCRQMNEGLPCSRLEMCWGDAVDVPAFLDAHYTDRQREKIFSTLGRGRLDIISTTLQRVMRERQGSDCPDA